MDRTLDQMGRIMFNVPVPHLASIFFCFVRISSCPCGLHGHKETKLVRTEDPGSEAPFDERKLKCPSHTVQ